MKNLAIATLCLLPLLFACGGKKNNQETPAPAPEQEQIVPPGPTGHAGKPAQVRDEVNETLRMREQENERRLKEATGE
ncbi:hypothetical protein KKD52_16450 [Myxococcota bacterium]|nr:hypothetical protein [Myxococcota bacterium]MBU1412354.1 hypothetical protein [Myxococcota bacterium]MBU1511946.1 hypothetical protein [Myxococcota bacterium]